MWLISCRALGRPDWSRKNKGVFIAAPVFTSSCDPTGFGTPSKACQGIWLYLVIPPGNPKMPAISIHLSIYPSKSSNLSILKWIHNAMNQLQNKSSLQNVLVRKENLSTAHAGRPHWHIKSMKSIWVTLSRPNTKRKYVKWRVQQRLNSAPCKIGPQPGSYTAPPCPWVTYFVVDPGRSSPVEMGCMWPPTTPSPPYLLQVLGRRAHCLPFFNACFNVVLWLLELQHPHFLLLVAWGHPRIILKISQVVDSSQIGRSERGRIKITPSDRPAPMPNLSYPA